MSRHKKYKLRRAKFRQNKRSAFRKKIAALFAALLISAVVVSLWLILWPGGGPSGPPKAVIVDQLSLTYPNPAFVESVTDTLEQTGYVIDYYPSEEVTVDFYRYLQAENYKLIIFRVHSARIVGKWRGQLFNEVMLFTSERYNPTTYRNEQRELRLGQVYSYKGGPRYFGIGSGFIKSSMKGNFDGVTIIMMGCNGLFTEATADAFLQRSAKAVVSWDKDVSSSHTDAATERLLQYFLIEELPIKEAVAKAMTEVGPDPEFGAKLLVYPPQG